MSVSGICQRKREALFKFANGNRIIPLLGEVWRAFRVVLQIH
jgi:hypothetical protein